MFFYDGFVYGSELNEPVKVESVKMLPDRIMIITFSNNEQRVFDATVLTGVVFKPLEDESVFSDYSIDHGVITWKNGEIDCSPECKSKNSYEYSAPAV